MRSGTRTLLAVAPAAIVVAAAWLRLEHPLAPLWRPAALVGLALAVGVVPRRSLRALALVVAVVGAGWIALGVSLLPSRPLHPGAAFGLVGPGNALAAQFGNGFADFYGTHLPFDPRVHVEMGRLVLAALFCFTLLVALLAAARRPVAAALLLIAGAGWPATLLGASHGIAVGAAILAASLVLLASLGSRRVPAVAVPAVAAVVLASVAVGSAAAARHGLVRWEAWDPTGAGGGPAGVGFVWDAQYGGISWPRRRTTVLEVRAPTQPRYLRATVLDDFVGDAWAGGMPRPSDSLEPRAAREASHLTREVVTVEALDDTHLVGGSIPIRYEAGDAPIAEPEPGFGTLASGLAPGFRYTVWSYLPRVTAGGLRRSRPDYPAELLRDGMLAVGDGVDVPPFGAPDRVTWVDRDLQRPHLRPYRPLFHVAERVAGAAATPYDAVEALDRWFLEHGGFSYSNHPRVVAPPLVGFVTRTRAGYCQYFAGAMALMLRYLGIPARVAVGFWGGTYDAHRRAWIVTDHDAHAWVEVWFRGYGWLPFDPTPAAVVSVRTPTIPGAKQQAGLFTDLPTPGLLSEAAGVAARAASAPRTAGGSGSAGNGRLRRQSASGAAASHDTRGEVALIVLLVLAAGVGGIVVTKWGVASARRLARGPRRVAAACREELAGFLVDQRVEPAASATLGELGELLQHEFGVDARAFVAAATAARFGRLERAEVAAVEARRELRALLDRIRGGLTRRERLLGLLSLRSLVRPRAAVDGSASLGSTRIVGSTGS